MSIRAIYENGVFKPLEEVSIEEAPRLKFMCQVNTKRNGQSPSQ